MPLSVCFAPADRAVELRVGAIAWNKLVQWRQTLRGLLANESLRPILDGQSLKAGEVLFIGRREHESVHMGNGRDLAVNVRSRSAERFKSCPFLAVPRRRSLVVRQNRKRCLNHLAEIRFERGPAFPLRQASTTICELMPDWRRNRALGTVRPQMFQDRRIRSLGDR